MKVSYFLFILLLSVVFSSCNHNNEENDFALLTQRDQWSHEYALGSPTWDTLELSRIIRFIGAVKVLNGPLMASCFPIP